MKNVQVNTDGLQFDNANGTHTNVNTTATADAYINLPASSGTLALTSDVTSAAGVTLSATMSSPVTLTGSKQTVVTLPAITTSGVYRVEIVAEANRTNDYDGSARACIDIVGGTIAENLCDESGTARMVFNVSGTPYTQGVHITDNDTPASFGSTNLSYKTDGAGARNNPNALYQYQYMYLTSSQTVRVRCLEVPGIAGSFTFTTFTIKATLISAVTL